MHIFFTTPIAAAVLCCATSPLAQTVAAVAPTQSVAGKSQAEWSAAWWQWAGSFDEADSPVTDRTGAQCGARQNGAVWFLAGTFGTQRTVRTCSVPRGKYLFFPLVNYVVMPPADRPINCAGLTKHAALATNRATALVVDVDGKRLGNLAAYRQATAQCFDMGALAAVPTQPVPAAANGYYVMLKPLAAGTHTINFGGALPAMAQAVTYTIVVR
jgi:hypothetical protein